MRTYCKHCCQFFAQCRCNLCAPKCTAQLSPFRICACDLHGLIGQSSALDLRANNIPTHPIKTTKASGDYRPSLRRAIARRRSQNTVGCQQVTILSHLFSTLSFFCLVAYFLNHRQSDFIFLQARKRNGSYLAMGAKACIARIDSQK